MEANTLLDGFVMRNRFSAPTNALPSHVLDQTASPSIHLLNLNTKTSPAAISFNFFSAEESTGSQGGQQLQTISHQGDAMDTK